MAAPIPSTTNATTVFEPNATRAAYIVENTDANRAYILHGEGTVSATNFTYSLAQNANAEPKGYTGKVSVVWAGDGSGYLMNSETNR